MKIDKLPNDWYRITRTNIFRKILFLNPIEKRFKHIVGGVFTHAPHRGVYMTENGSILSPFYDKNVDRLDGYRRKLECS